MPRIVQVEFKVRRKLSDDELINFFSGELKYKYLGKSGDALIFEKGSKLLTYLGLTNWNILYRKVFVKNYTDKINITYNFSWLSNVISLGWAASGELNKIKDRLNHLK